MPDGGTYLMCEIVDVVKKTYFVEASRQVESAFVVAIAGKKYPKPVRYSDVSNSRISEQEFNSYLRELQMCKTKPLSLSQTNRRQEKFKLITTRVLSENEVKNHIQSSNVTVLSKEGIMNAIRLAQDEPDEGTRFDMIEKYQKQLQVVEREEELNRRAIVKSSNRIVEVNKRNRDANLKLDVVSGQKQRELDKDLASKGLSRADVSNPFERKETVARSIWKTGKKKNHVEEAEVPVDPVKEDKAAGRAMKRSIQLLCLSVVSVFVLFVFFSF